MRTEIRGVASSKPVAKEHKASSRTSSGVPRDWHTFSEQAQARIAAASFDPEVIQFERENRDPEESMSRSARAGIEQWDGAGKRPEEQIRDDIAAALASDQSEE